MADLNVVAGTVSALVHLLLEKGLVTTEEVDGLIAEARLKAADHALSEYQSRRAKAAGALGAAAGKLN